MSDVQKDASEPNEVGEVAFIHTPEGNVKWDPNAEIKVYSDRVNEARDIARELAGVLMAASVPSSDAVLQRSLKRRTRAVLSRYKNISADWGGMF